MSWWHYLMLVNIYLLLFYGFYVLLLRKETFFQLNRIYLITAALLSFFIPVIQSNWVKNLFITQQVQHTIYSSPLAVYQFKPIQHTHVTLGEILVIAYLIGMIFLLGRLALQLIALNRIMNETKPQAAFSFFKKIKLAEDQKDNEVIVAHERVHAKQWHSADVLMIEAVMIINWFNPVVYLYRYAIKHIHEYIADRQAVKLGTDKADYALLLLSQTFNAPAHQLVNPFFNHSLLKQRIMMLQKNKSQKIALVKYGLSAPLFVLMLVLSSATVTNSKTVKFINKKAEQAFLIPAIIDSNDYKTEQPVNTNPHDSVVIIDPAVQTKGKITDLKIVTPPIPNKDSILEKSAKPVFTSVEQVPEYPGGIEAFSRYLSRNIRYPAEARRNRTQGRVIVSFVVETDGSLTDVHVSRGIGSGADEEAMRVITESDKWKPGIQNGHPVRVAYSVPISHSPCKMPQPSKLKKVSPKASHAK